ncbi:flagellar protein FlaG [Dethiothermospora halolimnae]|uniref:flagellar protein FlaG n=1 Tax=Dethiothermospora halolimnae TaxID=3114390 RepID=UPI003CCB9C29
MKIEGVASDSNTKIASSNQLEGTSHIEKKHIEEKDIRGLANKRDYQLDVSEKLLKKAEEEANKKLLGVNKEVRLSVHKKTHDIMMKIIDTETKEVIKEIPPKKIIDMIANLMEQVGILVDEKV